MVNRSIRQRKQSAAPAQGEPEGPGGAPESQSIDDIVVLNDTPRRSIPEATRERIRAAAIEFNYKPNMIARSLLGKPMRSNRHPAASAG